MSEGVRGAGPALHRIRRTPATCSAANSAAALNARGLRKWIIPLGLAIAYLLFALAVHLRMLDSLDLAVDRASRPGDVWGPVQIRSARVVNELRPSHLAIPLLVLTTLLSLLRRSLRPVVVVGVIAVSAAVVALGTKWVMAHSEADTTPVGHGSFPSGHAVSIVIVLGALVLLLRPETHWGWILPAGVGSAMGSALVLAAVHPATDVIGAGLLAAAVLIAARTAGLGQWAGERQGRRVG